MVDLARTYSELKQYDKAFALLKKASQTDPKLEAIYRVWAVTLFLTGNYKESWDKVKVGKKINDQSIPPDFIKALSEKLPEPK